VIVYQWLSDGRHIYNLQLKHMQAGKAHGDYVAVEKGKRSRTSVGSYALLVPESQKHKK
jgi:hypothetical protein